jgi:hypothetical protein
MNTEPMRLDEAGATFPYVYDTREWLHRCAKRMLELDPELDPIAAMHVVDGMAVSSRWRLMLPEAVAEALYEDCRYGGPAAFGSRADRGGDGV